MTRLGWRECRPGDLPGLHQFECTTPPRRRKTKPWGEVHPRKWELSLQREIHSLTPRCNDRKTILLGEDSSGLVAVTVAELERDASETHIRCVAIASESQHLGLGDEAIEQAIQWAMQKADAGGFDRLLLTACTHPKNDRGKALVRRNGFSLKDSTPTFDRWHQQIELV